MITYRNKIDYLITRSQSIWESLIFCSHKNTLTKWKNRNANSLNLPEAVLLIGRNPWGIHAYNTWNGEIMNTIGEMKWKNWIIELHFDHCYSMSTLSTESCQMQPMHLIRHQAQTPLLDTHSPQGRRHNSLK